MTILHQAAGLCIAAGERIPGLPIAGPDRAVDVRIHLRVPPPWRCRPGIGVHESEHLDGHGHPVVTVARHTDGFHFHYADGTDIWLDCHAATIWCTWTAPATLEDTATYLTGPVLGFALRLRGALALHASAVAVNGRAIVLVGRHGAGKSTTAAALGRRGCGIITDDVLRLREVEGQWRTELFACDLRLWPEGAALVLGEPDSLPRIAPGWNKRALNAAAYGLQPASGPALIGGIVFLMPREDPPRAPRLEPVGLSEAVVALATHSSASHLLDTPARAREFEALGAVVRAVPSIRATASTAAVAFEPFVDLVHEWARAVTDA